MHAFVNELERPIGTYLYGRRMYETMRVWETMEDDEAVMRDFAAIWQAADKVVYSRTLEAVSSARTRIEREFEPEAIRRLKATAARDITVGGPELAGQALAAGLVDELQLFVVPAIVGAGTPSASRRPSPRPRTARASAASPTAPSSSATPPTRPSNCISFPGREAGNLMQFASTMPPMLIDGTPLEHPARAAGRPAARRSRGASPTRSRWSRPSAR